MTLRWFILAGLASLALSCRVPRDAPSPFRHLDIAVNYTLRNLDPHAETTFGSFEVLSNVYEPLVLTGRDVRLSPGLAVSWESPDPLTWIFHLRPGTRFHDGHVLEAEDVVYSVRRLVTHAGLRARGHLQGVSDVQALDPATVLVKTQAPEALLLNNLSFVLIVRAGAGSLETSCNGTGPYRLHEWSPTARVVLRRHEGYWGPRPVVDEATFHLGLADDEILTGLTGGRYQLTASNSRALADALGRDSRFVVQKRNNYYVRYLGFDMSRSASPFCPTVPNPFKDRRVRHAIHLGIDRRRLASALPVRAAPATQLVPQAIFGFNPAIPEPVADLERARSLMREAGLGAGFDVTLHARALFGTVALLVKSQLADIGIRVDVRTPPDAEYFDRLRNHGMTLWIASFGCPTGDLGELLVDAVHTPDQARRFGGSNYGGFSDPDVDRLIEESSALQSMSLRREALKALMQRLMDDLVWVPLYVDEDVFASDSRLSFTPRDDSYLRMSEIGVKT